MSRLRRDYTSLSTEEKKHLANVFAKMGTEQTNSDYQDIAKYHGLDKNYCHVDDPSSDSFDGKNHSFLGWHRLYVLDFENRMRKIDPNITLPYLDWASDTCVKTNKIPQELNSGTMSSALVDLPNRGDQTSRDPGDVQGISLQEIREKLDHIFKNDLADSPINSTQSFSFYLQVNPHNDFHVWCNGDMSTVDYSAFDPIFWLHHCNIDRLWTVWQKSSFGKDIQDTEISKGASYLKMDFSQRGFQHKYGDVMDNNKLPGGISVSYQNEKTPFQTGTNLRTFSLRAQPTPLFSTEKHKISSTLLIHNLGHSLNSFQIVVDALIDNHKIYVGTSTLFGHGECCTETECKKKYKGPTDPIDTFLPLGDVDVSHVKSFTLKIFEKSRNKSRVISLEELEKQLFRDNKNPVSLIVKSSNKSENFHYDEKSKQFVRSK